MKLPCKPELIAKLAGPGKSDEDFFGQALAMTRDTLWIGAPGDDTGGLNAGAVYVYLKNGNTWTQRDILLPGDADEEQKFGSSIAVDERHPRTLVIGSPGDSDFAVNAGAAYVFVRDAQGNWVEHTKLVDATTPEESGFGYAVDIHGDTIVAGAPFEDNMLGNTVGNAYVYEKDGMGNWTQKGKLFPNIAPSGAIFGSAVAVHGSWILVGAPFVGNGFIPGSVTAFKRFDWGWVFQENLSPLTSVGRDRFGSSIALAEDLAVIGSPRDGVPPIGLANLFGHDPRSTWTAVQEFSAPDFTLVDRFGGRVFINGSRLLVSATNNQSRGAVYLYDFISGKAFFNCRITAPDGADFDLFGSSISLVGETAAIGASYHDANASDDGAVYIFSISKPAPPPPGQF